MQANTAYWVGPLWHIGYNRIIHIQYTAISIKLLDDVLFIISSVFMNLPMTIIVIHLAWDQLHCCPNANLVTLMEMRKETASEPSLIS